MDEDLFKVFVFTVPLLIFQTIIIVVSYFNSGIEWIFLIGTIFYVIWTNLSSREQQYSNAFLIEINYCNHHKGLSEHTLTFKIGPYNFYVCARCTGICMGIFMYFLIKIFKFETIFLIKLIIITIFSGIFYFEWVTNKTRWRKGTKYSRNISGFFLGTAITVYLSIRGYFLYKIFVILIIETLFIYLRKIVIQRTKKYRSIKHIASKYPRKIS